MSKEKKRHPEPNLEIGQQLELAPDEIIELDRGNVYQSLADFQQVAPTMEKTLSNDFAKYKYADLTLIVEKVKPILYEHKLVLVQTLKGKGLLTELIHLPSMSKIESYCDIPENVQMKGQNPFQVMGSAITYFRRYQYVTILGLVVDDDTDARVTKTGKPKLDSSRFADAVKALKAGETTLDEIMEHFTLSQAQKLELTNI